MALLNQIPVSRLPDGIKFSADQVVADSIPVIAEATDSDKTRQLKPDVVEKIDIFDSLKPLSLSTQDGSQAVNPNHDNQSLQDGIFCQEPKVNHIVLDGIMISPRSISGGIKDPKVVLWQPNSS
ncbi:hypothetical protein L2E82_15205 [Cichorium intybus]|uniref:Uncharacterized protein n=1 Tax=Cichorium intybus TaxID=13427 RepID=A0ACB9F2R5_CICIN|nr:hypothetical protein L2E82_15205 [Cichorium intybus]